MVKVRQPTGYQRPSQVDLSEAVGYHIGRGVRGVITRIARAVWTYPLVVLGLVIAIYIYARLGRTPAILLVGSIAAILLVAHRFPDSPIGHLRHLTYFTTGRARELRERREAPLLGEHLGHKDHQGNTLPIRRIYDHHGAVVGLSVEARGVPASDLERRLPMWAAALGLPHGQHLILRPGDHHGHHRVDVVPDLAPLPEIYHAPGYGDFVRGLVLGIREDGNLLLWKPDQSPHMLVSGATGSGKSGTTKRQVACWLAAGGEVWLGDSGKGTAFIGYEVKQGVRARMIEKHDILEMCKDFQQMMNRRYESARHDASLFPEMRPQLLVLEEAATLLMGDSGRSDAARQDRDDTAGIQDAITAIGLRGREARCFMVLAPQRGDASLLSGLLRDNLGYRLVQLRSAKDSTVELGIELSKSSMVPGREPPCRVSELPTMPGRVLGEDQDGYFVAQIAMVG